MQPIDFTLLLPLLGGGPACGPCWPADMIGGGAWGSDPAKDARRSPSRPRGPRTGARAQRPLPILHVAGESDRIVRFAAQERSIARVRALNGCVAEGKPAGKWCLEYPSPRGTSVVTMIHPGGHGIPDEAPARIVAF